MEPHPGVFCSNVRTEEWEPAGDLASLPAGLETTWHITPPFTELWVLA